MPGKPSPPPISLRGTFWHLERPHGETRIGVAFSDPTNKIAPSSQELNMWLSEPLHTTTAVIEPLQSGGFTCAMCKELLPYVANHECKSECASLWSWLQSSCADICEELVKYAPDEACHLAGYC